MSLYNLCYRIMSYTIDFLKLTEEEKANFSREGKDLVAMKCHERKREEREWADNLFGFSFKAAVKEGKEERERERRAEKRKPAQSENLPRPRFGTSATEPLSSEELVSNSHEEIEKAEEEKRRKEGVRARMLAKIRQNKEREEIEWRKAHSRQARGRVQVRN